MRFADASMLVFLALPAIVAAALTAGIWLRKRSINKYGNNRTVQFQIKKASPYLRAVKGIALVLGVSGLVLASARPQYGGRIQMLKKRGIDVVVALDFSKSMLAQDTKPNRLERAKLELSEFIDLLTGDRIGLVAFAGDTMQFPLTTDYAAAKMFWKDLSPYDMPLGGTAIGKALTAATRMLTPQSDNPEKQEVNAGRSKVVLLLTDGEDHFGDPVEVAQKAGEKDIIVHVVGIGSDSPELIPRYLDDGTTLGYQKNDEGEYVTTALTSENEDKLKDIAAKTGGRYFRAGSNLTGMTAVVQEIRKLKQTEVKARQVTVYEEVFQWFLAPAILFLLLAFLVPERYSMKQRRKRQ